MSGEPSLQPEAEKLETSIALVASNNWEEDIISEITGVVISPSRIERKDLIGKGDIASAGMHYRMFSTSLILGNFGKVFKGFMDTNVGVALKSVKGSLY